MTSEFRHKCSQITYNWLLPSGLLLVVCSLSFISVLQRLSPGEIPPLPAEPLPPARCYRCDNYFNLMEGHRINEQMDVEFNSPHGGNILGAGGIAAGLEKGEAELCTENVNRSALAAFQFPGDSCDDLRFNGCFKMVTKSYRVTSGLGREQLVVTVVTRNCAEIPHIVSLGCQKIYGGAGMIRELCYCKGEYCNGQMALKINILVLTACSVLFNL